jgi:predicted transcriptional regulator
MEAHRPYAEAYARVEPVARKQVLVQLDDALVRELDVRAERAGVSRSELIRRAIAAQLRDLDWTEQEQAAVESYRRRPESWTGRGWPQE